MPDSQSSEPGFESPFATVSKIGHFRSLHWRPSWLSCINEYLAIDSGGHVSDLVVARNCCMARMLPGEAELVSEWTGLPGRAKSVKRFERSNGLDTALYKNYLFLCEGGHSLRTPKQIMWHEWARTRPNSCRANGWRWRIFQAQTANDSPYSPVFSALVACRVLVHISWPPLLVYRALVHWLDYASRAGGLYVPKWMVN